MTPETVSRVNYFDGEALLRSDFDAEQAYHKGARERLSAGLLRAGVVSGMDVTWSAQTPTQVTVTAGMVLDCKGREIVLLADQVVPLDALTDGKQNYLTVRYEELLAVGSEAPAEEFKRIEEAPFFDCTPDYDPNGPEVLLAVIEAQGGNIQAVRYQYGNYSRRHVGAALGEVEFVLESNTAPPGIPHGGSVPQRMSISAQQDDLTGERYLDICAPEIRFDGQVQATGDFSGQFDGTVSGHATLDGTFTGTFTGNGAGLTGVKATGYWQQNTDGGLFYTGGNVGINDAQPTALLTVGQPVNSRIGRGLMTASNIGNGIVTVEGYQTNFTNDMVGKILQFGVVLRQQATIASVEGDDSLTLDESFPLGLGPTSYGYILASSGQTAEVQGQGMITPDGKTVTASGGAQFKSQMKLNTGDVLVIDRFVPQQQVITSKISGMPANETTLTLTHPFSEDVTNSAYVYSTEPDRWITGQGTISSVGTQVTGAGTTFMQLPAGATLRAMATLDIASVPQTWRVDSVSDPKHLTMHKISIEDGSPLLPASSAFMMTTWELMRVGGELQPATPPALTVVQNNGTVPNTVAINVDDRTVPIDSHYALQVNGPTKFEGGALTVDGELDVDGDLHVTGWAKVDADLTAGGDLDVIGKGTVDGSLTVKSTLDVLQDANITGNAEITGDLQVSGTSQFTGAMTAIDIDATGTATFSGPVGVTSTATFDVKCPATFDNNVTADTLTVNHVANVTGALNANGGLDVTNGATIDSLTVSGNSKLEGTLAVTGDSTLSVTKVDGDLTVTGQIIGTLKNKGSIGFGDYQIVKNSPYTINNSSPNYGQILTDSSPYVVPADGIFLLNTDNDCGSSQEYYAFTFGIIVVINDALKFGGTAFEDYVNGSNSHANGKVFISIPVKANDKITAWYNGAGANNLSRSINISMFFCPIQIG